MLKRLFLACSTLWVLLVLGSVALRGGITQAAMAFAAGPPAAVFFLWRIIVFVLSGKW